MSIASLRDVAVEQLGDGSAIVSFTGEHDLFTSPEVKALLHSLIENCDLVVADFSRAHFVDSSLLHTLLSTNELARERGTSFRLRLDTPAIVKRAFEISGVLEQISWAHSTDGSVNGSRPEVGDGTGT